MTYRLQKNYTKEVPLLLQKAHNRFPNLEIWQRDWEAPGNLTWKASGIQLQNFHRTGETGCWRAQTKPCVYQDPGERPRDPTRDWARFACECLGVSGGGTGWQWPVEGSGALTATVLGATACWHKSFGRRLPVPPLHLPKFGFRPNYRGEHSPTHQQKIGLKIYWVWPRPPEQDPVFPTASSSHQEVSTSLLSSSIRGQTEWKPQSQETNQTEHMDHSLV